MKFLSSLALVLVCTVASAYPGDYGPGRTAQWYDAGTYQAPKIKDDTIRINVNDAYVNEIILTSIKSDVRVKEARVLLTSGEVYNLNFLLGHIQQNRQFRSVLNSRASLRVRRIDLNITSPDLIGPRGQLNIVLGIARSY